MKLVSFVKDRRIRPGLLADGRVIDITESWNEQNPPQNLTDALSRLREFPDRIEQLIEQAGDRIDLADIKLLAPIRSPGKVIGLAGNYTEHIKEAGMKLGLSEARADKTVPRPFLMPTTTVTGPGAEIPWPTYSEHVDYEIELGVIIGSKAQRVSPDEAISKVAGYTIVNDISARSAGNSRRNRRRTEP